MRLIVVLLLTLTATLATSGCTEFSKVMVAGQNQQQEAFIEHARSRLDDPMVTEYLQGLGTMVLESARRLDHVDDPTHKTDQYLDIYDKFTVLEINDVSPNAFVTGDDYAAINTALIATAESPEELVMILGHEFGHLRNQHLVQYMTKVQYAVVSGIVAEKIAKMDAKGKSKDERELAGEKAAATAQAVFLTPNPDKESESDATGVEIMAELGLDLHYADDFFVRMLALYGDAGGTHPKPSVRIARVNAQIAKLEQAGYKPTRTLDRASFLAMRDRVRQLVRDGINQKTIVYFSEEKALASQNQTIVKPMGCGPLYADPVKVTEIFYRTVGVLPQH